MTERKFKPFIFAFGFVIIISVLIFFIFSYHFESYEIIFASIIAGVYTFPLKDLNIDTHIGLFPFYSWLNSIFPKVYIFGYVLIIYNLLSIMLLYNSIVYYLKFKKIYIKFWIILCILAIFLIENLVHLNTLRACIIACVSILSYTYIRENNRIKPTISYYLFIIISLLFIAMVRSDALSLFGLLFLIIAILNKKFTSPVFLVGLMVFSTFFINKMITNTGSEAKKVFYYKENQLFDRGKINVNNPNPIDSINILGFSKYYIFDKDLFTLKYTNTLTRNTDDKSNGYFTNISLVSFLITINQTIKQVYSDLYIVILSLLILIFVIIYGNKISIKDKSILLFLYLIPIFLNLFIYTHARLISPYYSLLTVFLLIKLLEDKKNLATKLLMIVLLFIVFNNNIYSKQMRLQNKKYHTNINKLEALNKSINETIIIDNMDPLFFPINPFTKVKHVDAMFLNFFFFSSYSAYIDKWNHACNCNALALDEKMKYISNNKLKLISNQERMEFYKNYFLIKYNIIFNYNSIAQFSENYGLYSIILKNR